MDLGGQNTDALPDDQRVYTVRTDGKVHAFDGRSGKKLWDTFPARNDTPKLDFSDGELVMTTGGGRFQALEASSGEVRWTSRDVKDVSMIIGATPAGALLAWGGASKSIRPRYSGGTRTSSPFTHRRRARCSTGSTPP